MSAAKHSVTLARVKELKSQYKKNKQKILKKEYRDSALLPICETFDRAAFDQLLAQPGCVGIRIYFGMDEEMNVKLIVVGVNEKDEDIRPVITENSIQTFASSFDEPVFAFSDAQRCPPDCPTPPPPDDDPDL